MTHHLARVAFAIALTAAAAAWRSAPAAVVAAFACYLSAFACAHDLVHGSLALPRRLTDWLLAVVAQLMLVSGHAMAIAHLRHHARPLADDDFEGAAIEPPLGEAIVSLPRTWWILRRSAYRTAGRRSRRWQLAETAASAALVTVALAVPALHIHLAVVVTLQLTLPIWAGRIPHHPPAWLLAIAGKLAFTRSATVLSLLYHARHHDHPQVPCAQIASIA